MTTTSNSIGFNEGSKPSSRVLKPPGGGSSIMFDEPDGFHYRSPKAMAPVKDSGLCPAAKSDSGMSSGSISPTPSGSITPCSNENSGPSSVASTPVPSSPQSKAPAMPEIIETEVKSNGSADTPFPEIAKIKLDDVPTKAIAALTVSEPKSPGDSPKPVDAETPTSPDSKAFSPNTKGEENRRHSNGRLIKDRMKSSIFVYQDESPSFAQQKPPTPEVKKIEQQPQAPPRQRIPPGGFSTKLW